MKKLKLTAAVILCSAIMAIPSYAASWQKDPSGWQWINDDGTSIKNSWAWLDGNQDQIEECYYFDKFGYMLRDTVTPDGYKVNPDGSWIVDGVVQSRKTSEADTASTDETGAATEETTAAAEETTAASGETAK